MASEIAKLAALVLTNTVKVDEYLETNQLPSPSFHEDGPISFELSSDTEAARITAIEALLRLQDLLRGPVELIRPTVNAISLEAIYKYDIANKVPIHGEITIVELAKKCDIYEPDLRRILRFAIIYHRVFQEPRKGVIKHSAASRRLIEDPPTFDGLGLQFDDGWHSFARTVEAMQKWTDREPNKTGFSLAQNTDKSVFEYMEANPVKAKRFAGAMSSFMSFSGCGPEHLAHGFPWESLGNKTIVDVGGSEGKYSIALAKVFPDLKFIVQDLPAVVKAVYAKKPVPADLEDRVTFMAHDMFTEQPVSADVYLYRLVFHDWPDSYVIKILRQLIPALKPGAQVIINDYILPEPNTLSESHERQIRSVDMVMLSWFNSRERERDDWQWICQEIDPRFKFEDAWVPKGSALGIIKAVWRPELTTEVDDAQVTEFKNGLNGGNNVDEDQLTEVKNGLNGDNNVDDSQMIKVKNGLNGGNNVDDSQMIKVKDELNGNNVHDSRMTGVKNGLNGNNVHDFQMADIKNGLNGVNGVDILNYDKS